MSKFVFVKGEDTAKLTEQNIATAAASNYPKIRRIREIPPVHPKIEF
jgi:hypothetical protein